MARTKNTIVSDEPVVPAKKTVSAKTSGKSDKLSSDTNTKSTGKKTSSSTKKTSSATKNTTTKKPIKKKRTQEQNDVFSLDIGTRTVIGILGHQDKETFCVDYSFSAPHTKRTMIDGQIEDIKEVAKVVKKVKDQLEDKANIKLSKVSIAAAGRALKTRCASIEIDVEGKDNITEEMLRSYELEAVSKAQTILNEEVEGQKISFYCVGHTVIKYTLDDYPIKTLIGHKGKKVGVELIAAFLPSIVVESLYAVMDINGLDVLSLTLEPIAAMNVIIPPEVRLINIALVDIGAGTSDIAISQDGSIVAYAMATVAGDEITEDIIKKYIVDFDTAEHMKLSSNKDEITYKDILGFEHTIPSKDFYQSLFPAVDQLADTIAASIVEANGSSPAAVFLVGGGSLIPELSNYVAEKLGIPENRVAVGGKSAMKNINLGKNKKTGPEYVTPIGIGLTAVMQGGYDFSTIILNGKKMRVFDTKKLTVLDLLMMAGYKSTQIIGRSGRNLIFNLNGEKQTLKGEVSKPASILLNNLPASLDYTVKQGDVIEFVPAVNGISAAISLSDIAGDMSYEFVTVDSIEYPLGNTVTVNGKMVSGDYKIQNFDDVRICNVETMSDLLDVHGLMQDNTVYYKGTKRLHSESVLYDGDVIKSKVESEIKHTEKTDVHNIVKQHIHVEVPKVDANLVPEKKLVEEEPVKPEPVKKQFSVNLNGKKVFLKENSDGSQHEFIELMSIADVDFNNPPPKANMILTINGKNASFMDALHEGDNAVVKWET